MPYEEDTIASVVDLIDHKKIYLPAIQRKFVWGEEQITKLMDSIMKGYPFGTFLFWKVKKRVVNDKRYSLYEFIKDYHERDNFNNVLAGLPFSIVQGYEDDTILSALDGQQRLTALYIALKGSLSTKIPYKHKSNDDAYPKRELYFDLRSEKKSEDDDITYSFSFLTEEEAANPSGNEYWYKVKNIVQFSKIEEVAEYSLGVEWSSDHTMRSNLLLLFTKIKDKSCKLINYFEVESDSIDDVLDIFVRVNSGGTVLSKTDLIFSTIVSFWDKARDEVDSLLKSINSVGNHYKFTNDFIMRACLYVTDLNINLKVESFSRDNVKTIKAAWPQIKESMKDTVEFLHNLGFNSENIIAYNAIYPVVYYRYKYGNNTAFDNDYDKNKKEVVLDVKMEIRKYMVISQIRHIFGKATTTALTTIRTEIKKNTGKFLFSQLQELKFGNEKKLRYDENDLKDWIETFEKNEYTFLLLSLLYPDLRYGQVAFHQDHMHPFASFESDDKLLALNLPEGKEPMDSNKISMWRQQRNTLANLQLLEGSENEHKSDESLEDWLSKPENMSVVKYLPLDIDYSLANFDEFLELRKNLLLTKLSEVLL